MHKRFLFNLLCVVCVIGIVVCISVYQNNKPHRKTKTTSPSVTKKTEYREEIRGVWIFFQELEFDDKSEENFRMQIDTMFKNVSSIGLNAVFVHVRAFGDAFYPSQYFPMSSYIAGKQGATLTYDPLAIMIETSKKYDLQFHAWINPYRVSSTEDLSVLADNNAAKIWLTDDNSDNDSYIIKADGKLYYNPAENSVQKLVIDGVREIVQSYDVDGIHFDDYFYPTTDESIDAVHYNTYCKGNAAPLSLDDWRRAQVNALMSGVYQAIKSIKPNVVFSISPQANVDYNYSQLYADVEKWSSTTGYADILMPQIYFGFEYPDANSNTQSFKFSECTDYWKSIVTSDDIDLCVGLGAYRAGEQITANNKTSDEWVNSHDIIKRQILDIRKKGINSFCIFSYRSLYETDAGIEERKNIESIVKTPHQ